MKWVFAVVCTALLAGCVPPIDNTPQPDNERNVSVSELTSQQAREYLLSMAENFERSAEQLEANPQTNARNWSTDLSERNREANQRAWTTIDEALGREVGGDPKDPGVNRWDPKRAAALSREVAKGLRQVAEGQ